MWNRQNDPEYTVNCLSYQPGSYYHSISCSCSIWPMVLICSPAGCRFIESAITRFTTGVSLPTDDRIFRATVTLLVSFHYPITTLLLTGTCYTTSHQLIITSQKPLRNVKLLVLLPELYHYALVPSIIGVGKVLIWEPMYRIKGHLCMQLYREAYGARNIHYCSQWWLPCLSHYTLRTCCCWVESRPWRSGT